MSIIKGIIFACNNIALLQFLSPENCNVFNPNGSNDKRIKY